MQDDCHATPPWLPNPRGLEPFTQGQFTHSDVGKAPIQTGYNALAWQAKNIRHLDYKGGRIPEEAPKANAK